MDMSCLKKQGQGSLIHRVGKVNIKDLKPLKLQKVHSTRERHHWILSPNGLGWRKYCDLVYHKRHHILATLKIPLFKTPNFFVFPTHI